MRIEAGNTKKVLIVDPKRPRADEAARRLRRQGYDPIIFSDAQLAFAHAFRTRDSLAAAVIEADGGRERALVQSLRLLRPDLRILAGVTRDRRPAPRTYEPMFELPLAQSA